METIDLLPGITLRCVQDSRFKQGCLSLQLVRPMSRQEAAMNALIPSVLLRGTRRCPDLRAVTQRLDGLYGASVRELVRRAGDYQTLGLYCGFMDDRFALPGDRVLGPMVEFLGELLLDSPLEGGGFLPSFVEQEKTNLISAIAAQRNDKQAYAMGQLLKTMCREDSFGLSRLGEPEDVAAIQPLALRRHYEQVLKTSPMEIFYVGSADPSQVEALLRPIFQAIPRQPQALPPQTPFHPCPGQVLEEPMAVAQGKLCLGFTTPIVNSSEAFAAMQVLNTLYGGGMISKLFQNVREKLSLCYAVGSGYYGSKGILTVYAGIDFDKEPQARQEILRQLKLCQAGEITQLELDSAKEALLSSLRATHDSPGSIEGFYETAALTGLSMTPQAYMAAIQGVTKEQVVAAANTLTLHSRYFLKGEAQ